MDLPTGSSDQELPASSSCTLNPNPRSRHYGFMLKLKSGEDILENKLGRQELHKGYSHKKAKLTRLKSGSERVSVSIGIYNQESATTCDITLNDGGWTQDIFDIVSGTWCGGFSITFCVPTKAALQEAYSTPIVPLDILADRPPEKKFEWAKKLLVKYRSLISMVFIVVLFVYLVATPSKSSGAKGSKKKR